MDLFTAFNGADKALQTFRFKGGVDGIVARVGKCRSPEINEALSTSNL